MVPSWSTLILDEQQSGPHYNGGPAKGHAFDNRHVNMGVSHKRYSLGPGDTWGFIGSL